MTVKNTWRRKPQDEFENRREVPWPIGAWQKHMNNHSNVSDNPDHRPDPPGLMVNHPPASEIQALMEAAPGDQPAATADSQATLSDELDVALAAMDERLRWVFQAHVNRGLSFAQIGREIAMSKSRAHELYQLAQAELIALLRAAPAVQEHLEGNQAN